MPEPLEGLPGLDALLADSVRLHGHLCPGQVLGVRMAMLGLREAGISDPKGNDRRDLVVFVEMDRCATDAVQSVTGCSLGRRSLKHVDYGKMAATFCNLKTGRAVRVLARESSRSRALGGCTKEGGSAREAQIEAYKKMPDGELFTTMAVRVAMRAEDMPGKTVSRVRCHRCGESVQDRREAMRGGIILCRPCAQGGAYYELIEDLKEGDNFS